MLRRTATRRSSPSERRRVVAALLAMTQWDDAILSPCSDSTCQTANLDTHSQSRRRNPPRVLQKSFAQVRAQGMPGASMRPQPCVRMKKAHKRSHYGHTGNTRHSPRDGFTAYSTLFPAIGLSCHRHRCDCRSNRHLLDVSVETSEPRGFVVRARLHKSRSTVLVPVPPKL